MLNVIDKIIIVLNHIHHPCLAHIYTPTQTGSNRTNRSSRTQRTTWRYCTFFFLIITHVHTQIRNLTHYPHNPSPSPHLPPPPTNCYLIKLPPLTSGSSWACWSSWCRRTEGAKGKPGRVRSLRSPWSSRGEGREWSTWIQWTSWSTGTTCKDGKLYQVINFMHNDS